MTELIVAAVSKNTNAFGLWGMILVSRKRQAYEVAANDINVKRKGDMIQVAGETNPEILLDLGSFGFEIPKVLDTDVPAAVVEEMFASIAAQKEGAIE